MIESTKQKIYNFKSVGEQPSQVRIIEKEVLPIGILTPIRISNENDFFVMSTEMKDQIKDNSKNLLLTNWGERLLKFDFGANLAPLLYELSTENGDMEAMRRIKLAVSKWMPYISLEDFVAVEEASEDGLKKIKIMISYSVEKLGAKNEVLSVTFNFAG